MLGVEGQVLCVAVRALAHDKRRVSPELRPVLVQELEPGREWARVHACSDDISGANHIVMATMQSSANEERFLRP